MFETGEFSAEILKNAFEGRSRYGGDDPGRKLGSMGYFTYLQDGIISRTYKMGYIGVITH